MPVNVNEGNMARDRRLAPLYEAGQRFVDAALQHEDSLFTPGQPVWSLTAIQDFYDRFVQQPDLSNDTFEVKLHRQLEGAAPETIQLTAELFYVHLLMPTNIGAETKRRLTNRVLSWMDRPVSIPPDLDKAFNMGIASIGAGITQRDRHLRFLLEFVRAWRQLKQDERARALEDPWAFKAVVYDTPVHSAYVQREALLYLVYPDTFEEIVSTADKQLIAERFAYLAGNPDDDIDKKLLHIRQGLIEKEGYSEGFHFWEPSLKGLWKPQEGDEPFDPTSASDVQRFLEAMYPDAELRRMLLEQLARSITIAHDTRPGVSPRTWQLSLLEREKTLRLNVGHVEILVLKPREVDIAVYEDMLDASARSQFGSASRHERWAPGTVLLPLIPTEQIDKQFAKLREAHVRAIEIAIEKRPHRSRWYQSHASGVLAYMRDTLGIAVPDPDYETAGPEEQEDQGPRDALEQLADRLLLDPSYLARAERLLRHGSIGLDSFKSAVAAKMALRRREIAAANLFSTVQTVKLEHAYAEPCLRFRARGRTI